MSSSEFICKICGLGSVIAVANFAKLPRVTSDCLPYSAGGALGICQTCAAVQKFPNEQWFADIADIYKNYHAYHQSGGEEQAVFKGATGVPEKRSVSISRQLDETGNLPKNGKLLDVGCGNGAFLAGFSQVFDWQLDGLDLDDHFESRLQNIRGFENLHTCELSNVPAKYDLISFMHSLEHFPDPLDALNQAATALSENGRILVQVPNAEMVAFDYLVADHLSHFSPETLRTLVGRSDLQVEILATNWVTKELSLIAKRRVERDGSTTQTSFAQAMARVQMNVDWLHEVIKVAGASARGCSQFGIFGTSVVGTWLYGAMPDAVTFFVEP
ncbi:MAG: class I SAM-dependent methyltransferase [Proteobacteria bacterium]|nr:class I SAM-dependent methyltransferase [Pseudomonadota bacterium]